MNIIIKNKLLLYKGYKLKCSIGKSGITLPKKEPPDRGSEKKSTSSNSGKQTNISNKLNTTGRSTTKTTCLEKIKPVE